MKHPLLVTVAATAALALIAPPASSQAAGRGGSSAPCDIPLAWRVGDVDARFGVTAGAVRAAVQAAGSLWERATGARLFVHDPRAGFPVNLVHDGRQVEADERRRAEAEVRVADYRLEAWRADVDRLVEAHRADAAAYQTRTDALAARVALYNRRVQAWNDRGGAPADTVRAIEAMAASLDAESAELDRWHQRLEESTHRIQDEQRRLSDAIERRNRRTEQLGGVFPARAVQSGLYREQARIERGRVVSVVRAIDIFRFDDTDDLMRIIAHELGHALGLGHADSPGALMSEEYGRDGSDGPPAIDPRDLALLRARCPQLRTGADSGRTDPYSGINRVAMRSWPV